ncbi:MAG: SpoIIE family protein phosphatase, partial [Terracidiphilus sp.]
MTPGENFIEVDFCQRAKHGQLISGDVCLSEKVKEEGRVVSVLSDGLGSGVKASVLASMTATMAMRFAASGIDIRRSAEIIMDTLPICSVRKISYSTFTVVDMAGTGQTRIIEHGNPSFLLIRPDGQPEIKKTEVRPQRWQDRVISFTSFDARREDRIVFFSDGITQAGMGEFRTP